MLARFRKFYGSHPLHLLTMIAGFAVLDFLLVQFKDVKFWNPGSWWQSIIVWFAAAVVLHDLVLFPAYALADRLIGLPGERARRRRKPVVPALNYIRVPALGAGLTLLVFLPGIIEQGAPTYLAATGQTQEPFLGRWLLLVAAMFAASALAYGVRVALVRLRRVPE